MARYIDADKFIAELEQEKTVALEFGDGVAAYEIEHTMNLISMQPTADVVPKSEVEELQAKVARLRKENVELLVSKETEIHISMEKLVRVRTEHPIFKAIEEKATREIFEEIEKWLATDGTLLIITAKKFAEIKNKYTEE